MPRIPPHYRKRAGQRQFSGYDSTRQTPESEPAPSVNEHLEPHEREAEHERDGFQEGQKVWIIGDGSQRPGIYVGATETASWLGGPPRAYVVYADDRAGAEVPLELILPRDD